jgi:hypothetical protein
MARGYPARVLRPRTAVIALSCAAVAATAAGCGSESADEQVRGVVTRFGEASAKKDYQEICDVLIAKSLSDNVEEFGLPCELAFKQGLQDVRRPRLAIRSVRVDGSRALVRVHSTAANQAPSDDTLELREADGEWRITSLAGRGAGPAKPRGK